MILSETAPSHAQVRAAARATYIAFVGSGFAFASWASRIPQVRDRLDLTRRRSAWCCSPSRPVRWSRCRCPGPSSHRFGSRPHRHRDGAPARPRRCCWSRSATWSAWCRSWSGCSCSASRNGAWDVAMNVQGALVERQLGRSIMSRFHAGFSLGTVAGALVGAAMVALRVPVTAHLIGRRPSSSERSVPSAVTRGSCPTQADDARRRRRRVARGVAGRLARAAHAADRPVRAGLRVRRGHRQRLDQRRRSSTATAPRPRVGTLAFAVFLAAMTVGRWFGPGLLDRYGRVAGGPRARRPRDRRPGAVRRSGRRTPVAFAGALLWGLGTSLGFPVGMSAGADDPRAGGRPGQRDRLDRLLRVPRRARR